jgi:hypothetical protein
MDAVSCKFDVFVVQNLQLILSATNLLNSTLCIIQKAL